jgi:hypothetical protein
MFLVSKAWPVSRADSLAAMYERIVWKMWDPQHLKLFGPRQPVTGIALLFFTAYYIIVYTISGLVLNRSEQIDGSEWCGVCCNNREQVAATHDVRVAMPAG